MDEQIYLKLKREVEGAKSAADEARGALTQLTKQLEDDFGCKSIKDGKAKLAKLEDELAEKEDEFQEALTKYRKKWKREEGEDDDA